MTESKTKKCTKCNEVKSFEAFYINNLSADGLYSWCKICFDASATVHSQTGDSADRSREAHEPVAKRCAGCRETKLVKYFPRDPKTNDGLSATCKVCHNQEERKKEQLILEQQQKRAKEKQKKSKEPEYNVLTEHKCSKCNMIKPVKEFYEQPGLKAGVSYQCRSCLEEYNQRYQKALEKQVEQEIMRRRLPAQNIPKERKCNGCGKIESNNESTPKTLIPVHAWFCDACKSNKIQVYVKKGTFVYDLVGREYKVSKVITDELVKGFFKKENGRWSRRKVNIYGNWKTKK